MTGVVGSAPAATWGDQRWPNRLFAAGDRASLRAHLATYGELDPSLLGPHLVAALERSGLTGRGGAAFPTGRKFAAMPHGGMWSRSAVVVANGAEGEPRSVKDAQLLRHAPHLVLDGLLAAAAAVQADRLYLYAGAAALGDVAAAIDERRDARRVRLVEAPETFVSGEASAVLNAIGKGVARPTDRTIRLTESGLGGRPTLVHNVETLAHVGLIARFGPDWFRVVGTPDDPGSRLVTVSGAVRREGVLEVRGGATLAEVLDAAGHDDEPAAVLVGGYHGAWVTAPRFDVALSRAGLAPFGAQPGAGVLYVISRRMCGLQATAEIVRYLAAESAGQCGPCRFGLPEIAQLLEGIAYGVRDPTLPRRLAELAGTVVGRGSCHHPDGTVRLVRSALSAFSADVAAHLSGRCLRTP